MHDRSTDQRSIWWRTVAIIGQALTAPAVADSEAAILTSDGVNVRLAGGGAAVIAAIGDFTDVVLAGPAPGHMLRRNGANQWVNEETPYDLSFFLPGTYSGGALMAQVVLDRAVTFPDGLFGAQGYAGVTADCEHSPGRPGEWREHRHHDFH